VNPGNAALGRGLDALLALSTPAAARDGLGVSQLAELLDADKSQVSRTLAVLDERGFVTRDADTLAYRLGWQVFSLAALAGDAPLISAARPVLLSLVAELGESAHLSVRQGDQVLTLATESPAAAIHAPGRVGGLTPLATTSAGRALATGFSDNEVDAAGLTQWTDQIATARTQGFAIVREEFEAGLVSVAAPIHDAAGQVIAAINVSAPSFRFESRLDDAALIVMQAAVTIGATLGGAVTV
jgi:DNA-binding IclR family transcriptional regulator